MIYFVTENFLKTKTHITQNVDAGILSPFIPMAVKSYLQPILGYRFTNDLLTKYNDNTLSPEEEELVDFIQYVVAFYAAYIAVPSLSFRVSNKGVQSQFGDYTASEGVATVEYIRNNILSFARDNESNLRAFLELNKESYPLYLEKINKEIQSPDRGETQTNISWL